MPNSQNILTFNVGFIAHQTIGFHREFSLDVKEIRLQSDFAIFDFRGTFVFSRVSQGLLLQANCQGEQPFQCVRCLEQFSGSLEFQFTELFAFHQNETTDSNLILPEHGRIDIAPLVREYALLAVPISPVCKPSCLGLCAECGENRNHTDCGHHSESVDPRLAVLKSLLKTNAADEKHIGKA